jgi:hypothetical protein
MIQYKKYFSLFLLNLLCLIVSGSLAAAEPASPDALLLIDQLEQSGKIQEAAWIAQESGNLSKAEELRATFPILYSSENFIYKLFIRRRGASTDGGGIAQRFYFNSGYEGIFKPDCFRLFHPISWIKGNTSIADARNEIAAYVIDQILSLDLVPYTIAYRSSGMRGSLQAFMKEMDGDIGERPSSIKNWAELLILDYLIDNSDRNASNLLLWEGQNRFVAIDHGLSFSNQGFTKKLILRDCTFSLDENSYPYVGLYKLSQVISPDSLNVRVRERIIGFSTEDVRTKLSGLLTSSQVSLLLDRLAQIRSCLLPTF